MTGDGGGPTPGGTHGRRLVSPHARVEIHRAGIVVEPVLIEWIRIYNYGGREGPRGS